MALVFPQLSNPTSDQPSSPMTTYPPAFGCPSLNKSKSHELPSPHSHSIPGHFPEVQVQAVYPSPLLFGGTRLRTKSFSSAEWMLTRAPPKASHVNEYSSTLSKPSMRP